VRVAVDVGVADGVSVGGGVDVAVGGDVSLGVGVSVAQGVAGGTAFSPRSSMYAVAPGEPAIATRTCAFTASHEPSIVSKDQGIGLSTCTEPPCGASSPPKAS
jgi:hypothetical protein